MPLELAEKRKEKEQLQAIRIKRGITVNNNTNNTNGYHHSERSIKTENEEFIDQIQQEIDERIQHIEEMKQLNMLKPNDERKIRLEIAKKLEEMNRLA